MQMQSSKLCKRDGGGGGLSSLPEEMMSEVLLRLPAKDLRRSRRVCKRWRALISDPAFFAARRSRSGAGPLVVAAFGSAPELQLRVLDDVGNVFGAFDVGSPALLAPTRLDLVFVDRMQLGAMVIDPASGRDFAVVGTPDPPRPWWDRSTSTAMSDYSFGRAAPSGDYKVLRLHVTWSTRYGRSQRCEVATITTDAAAGAGAGAEPTWRPRPLGPLSDTSCLFSWEQKATVNGVLYFMLHPNNYLASDGKKRIAAFDLESEEWKAKKIKGPAMGRMNEEDKWRITLTELNGALCMVQNVQVQHLTGFGGHYANIWLLKDPDRSLWVKEYRIQMQEERLLLFTKPLDVLTDGTLLLLNAFRKAAGNKNENCHRYILQLYNSSTKGFSDYMEMAEGFNGVMAFYTGSLQS